jgi:hypothetical protein
MNPFRGKEEKQGSQIMAHQIEEQMMQRKNYPLLATLRVAMIKTLETLVELGEELPKDIPN